VLPQLVHGHGRNEPGGGDVFGHQLLDAVTLGPLVGDVGLGRAVQLLRDLGGQRQVRDGVLMFGGGQV